MKVAHKFILRTYVGPMVLTFFIVMFILLMHFLWMRIDMLVGKGLSASVILELVMFAMATMIPVGLPLATLLASIMTLGNLGENNELLALKAAGISLPRIMKPLIILMCIVSIGSFFVINNLTPFSYKQMFSLMNDISRQKQEIKFNDGIFFNGIPNMSIRIGHQDANGRLNNVLIYNNSNHEKMQTTVADSGYIRISDDRKYLMVRLFNGQMYEKNRDYQWFNRDTLTHHIFDRQELLVPLSGFAFERGDKEDFNSKSETKTMGELTYMIDSLKIAQDSIINDFKRNLLSGYVVRKYARYKDIDSIPALKPLKYQLSSMDTIGIDLQMAIFNDVLKSASDAQNYVNYKSEFSRYTSAQLYYAQIDFQRKIALPFSIMIFFLIGAPLGAIIRKGGLGTPIVVSVVFFVIYYIVTILGEKFVKDGALPAYIGMWLSSIILFPIAIFLTYKSTNDSKLFNTDSYKLLFNRFKNRVLSLIIKIKNIFHEKCFKHHRRGN